MYNYCFIHCFCQTRINTGFIHQCIKLFGILGYKGNGNQEFLEKWLERVMINLDGTSIGTYNIENKEEILNALINC